MQAMKVYKDVGDFAPLTFRSLHWVVMSGQIHTPGTLPSVPTEWQAGWPLAPIWTL